MKIKAVLVLALSLALVGCSSDQQVTSSPPETVPGVEVSKPVMAKVPDVIVAVGTVRPKETAQLSAQMMGNVLSVNVREGDFVRRGQVLATIDAAQSQAAVERVQAALSAAQHELAASRTETSLSESTLKRYDTLFQRNSVSPQEYDEVKARYEGALARTEAAQSAEAQAKAAVAQAQTSLSYSRVRAPFDGIVTERRIDPGALAAPGMPLLTVEASGSYRLETTVDEASLRFVSLKQSVPVSLDAFPDVQVTGTVVQIIPAADPTTRTFLVKLELPMNPKLQSGLSGRASFSRGERDSLVLPRTSVIDRGALKGIYVLGADQVASLRYITVGNSFEEQFEVLSGVGPNELVVASPGDRELAGKRIEVK